MPETFSQWYSCQGLRFGIFRVEVEQGHLDVLDRDLPDGPVPVACYGTDERLRRVRAVLSLKVGEGQMRRAVGRFQATAHAKGIPQPVEHPSIVHLDERRPWEGVEVCERDGKGGEV